MGGYQTRCRLYLILLGGCGCGLVGGLLTALPLVFALLRLRYGVVVVVVVESKAELDELLPVVLTTTITPLGMFASQRPSDSRVHHLPLQ